MGLDTTHNAWHWPYSSFNDFRRAILKAYNNTDLFDYEGYESRSKKDNDRQSPCIPLTNIDDDGVYLLMNHSDCDGDIRWVDCNLVANSLKKITHLLSGQHFHNCIQFVNGLMLAYERKENLLFQ